MKKTKFLTTLVLILSMIAGLMGSAFAADSTTTTVQTGNITIENPIPKQSYYVYRVFDLESYNAAENKYSYTLNDKWAAFAKQDTINNVYITLKDGQDGKIYVEWKEGADAEAFANLALAYAKANEETVSIVDGISTTTNDPITFENLPLGYYLIDSSVGAFSALTTTNPNATVKEKNELTTVVKKVQENSTEDYDKENSAKIGDTVHFKSEITLGEGAENLVLHDKMDAGLTYTGGSVKVYIGTTEVNSSNYTVIVEEENQDCTFEIQFQNSFISPLTKGTVLLVDYSAVINENAKMAPTSNDNTTWVSFGDNITSTTSTTKTYTTDFDLLKTDANGKIITGATFRLYDVKEGGNPIALVKLSSDEDAANALYEYRIATSEDADAVKVTEFNAGLARVKGLDKAVYYLQETKAPEGYNLLAGRKEVDLTNGSITATTDFFGTERTSVVSKDVANIGGVQVINRAGTLLPSTGGTGTTLFYIAGILLMTAAAVYGVLRLRKNMIKNK